MSVDIKQKIQKAIQQFAGSNSTDNALKLFQTLGYNTERKMQFAQKSFSFFKESFIQPESKFNEEKALVKDWKYIDLLFQLSSAEMSKNETLFKETVARNEPASYLFFIVELSGKDYSRNQLAQIAREMNKPFPMHVFVLFKYANHITFSLIDRRQNKKILDKDVVEKVTHLYNISIAKPHAAHIQILYTFSFDSIASEAPKRRITSFADLQIGWRKVISTDILNKQFYLDYQKLSVSLIKAIYPTQIKSKLIAHQGVLNLLNRIMFIYFVQKKEWIMSDENFIIHHWQHYKASKQKDTFHKHWLNPIFFNAFNGKAWEAHKSLSFLPKETQTELPNFPYLNGGLFAYNTDYDNFILTDTFFDNIFNFFEGYIFTISEDTPYDVNLEINPELLGKMYEGMINATDLDDVDAENGIIYTERPEINFMTRRSFVEVLDKKLNGAVSREFLYHFIFDEPNKKIELLKHYKVDIQQLRDAIISITMCDPSCGSGSMLLGAIQLQMELIRVLDEFDGKPHSNNDDFNIKKQLISECIYGVDIKEWAVRIAELRLWLYMIAEANFTKEELTKTPLLPNLDFKLRCGNSLLQKFGDLNFTIDEIFDGKKKNSGAAKQLNEYIKKKKAFIQNQGESNTTYTKLKEEESAVFRDLIREMITEKEITLKNKAKQTSLFATATQQQMFAAEEAATQAEIEQLKKLRDFIRDKKRLPFSYDIDFMEIFLAKEDKGFDLMIGNPPYVRQEQILPPEDGEMLEYWLLPENKDEKAQVNKAYKEELNAKVYKTYPFLATTIKTQIEGKNKTISVYGSKVPGRSDLYCYFQLLCPHYLNSKGTFCFIISNSWLDVEFGGYVQHFLLKHTKLHGIYDCNVRSFDAAVNTIIYLHSNLQNIPTLTSAKGNYKLVEPINNTVQFIMNKIDFANASYAPLLLEQEHCTQNTFKDIYRVITLTQKELYTAGYDDEQVQYGGDKWGGKYLSGPEIFYRINSLGEDKNLNGKLSEYFDGERYLNTGGADGFFIVTKFDKLKNGNYLITNNSGIENPKNIFKGEIEAEFLQPLLKDYTRNSRKILIDGYDSLCLVVKTKPSKNLDKYIDWGIEQGFNMRSVTKSQNPYYKPTNQMLAGALVLVPRSFNDVFSIFYNPEKHLSLRYYRLHLKKGNLLDFICYFNSTLVVFFQEVLGNKSLGQGALDFFMADFLSMSIPIVNIGRSKEIFEKLASRKMLDIFTELGFKRNEPIREQIPNPLPDRKELDNIIFDELGLTQVERNEVYYSVAELVKQRLDKAASR